MRRTAFFLFLVALGGLAGTVWRSRTTTTGIPSVVPPDGKTPTGFSFSDITARAGIQFRHHNGATEKKFLVETMGSGGGFFDYDGDGYPDIYLVNGASLEGEPGPNPPRNALYHNNGDGTFEDVTRQSGTGDTGYGMGCAMADYDNDGDPDIYVTNLGPNVLYRNRGDGTFEEVAAQAGVADPQWGASCLFADVDKDGWLDLYVVNYIALSLEEDRYCGRLEPGYRAYCHISDFDAAADVFFRNLGDGTFIDWTRPSGLLRPDGKGLGVVGGDFDNDSDIDIYVANDTTANFLFRNLGDGTFEEVGVLLGAAYGEGGEPEAGMGLDAADYDEDGWLDLFVTNFALETNSLYRNAAGSYYENRTYRAGLASPSLTPLAFGALFLDLDLDGFLDIAVVNGHIQDRIALYYEHQTHGQPNQLFRNRGDGTYVDVSGSGGPAFLERRVSRGLAAADFDLDGDLDLLVTNCNDGAQLLENRTDHENHWVTLMLLVGNPPRAAIGARLLARIAGENKVREVVAGGSYLSQREPWIHLGLGAERRIDRLEIRWPSGSVEIIADVEADRRYRCIEGEGLTEIRTGSRRP
ncbi:MAG: CRTAC1 family protein [Planctomycetota bacterium]|nr:CRTAC1 family protein [Planctomycetota bacterium]